MHRVRNQVNIKNHQDQEIMNKYENEIIAKLQADWKYQEMNYQAFSREWRRLDDEEQTIKDKDSIKANENRRDKSATFERMYELDKQCTALLNAIEKLKN